MAVRLPRPGRDWTLKLAALGLAVLLWSVTKAEAPTRVPIHEVPVTVSIRDPGWRLAAAPAPDSVSIIFSGPVRELVKLAGERPRIVVPIEQVTDTVEVLQIRPSWIRLRGNLEQTRVEDVTPSTVQLRFQREATRSVPVAVRLLGAPPDGLVLERAPRPDPRAVRVAGAERAVRALDSVPLLPIDLGALTGPAAITVAVDTAALPRMDVAPLMVRVVVPLAARRDTVVADTAAADTLPPPDTAAAGGPGPPTGGEAGPAADTTRARAAGPPPAAPPADGGGP